MAEISVHLPGILASVAGETVLWASGDTVADAIVNLADARPELRCRLLDARGNPHTYLMYSLNERKIKIDGGFTVRLSTGDRLVIISAVAGG